MFVAVVTGEIVSTINHPFYDGQRMLVCERVHPDGKLTGKYVIAASAVDAGVGQQVLILDEGGSARLVVGDDTAPLRSLVVGIVDQIAMEDAS